MKDLFSGQAAGYAQYRPQYPEALLQYILSFVQHHDVAWDCGTGNGQTASMLSRYFDTVLATDISRKQLEQGYAAPNIHYRVEPENRSSLPDRSTDLITASQAAHWFDLRGFYAEVMRVAKRGSVLALWGYGLPRIDPVTDEAILRLYNEKLGSFWDEERKQVDEAYAHLYFPFDTLPDPGFFMECQWDLRRLEGFLNTWSALQHYILRHNHNPVSETIQSLLSHWPAGQTRLVRFPIFLKLARIPS